MLTNDPSCVLKQDNFFIFNTNVVKQYYHSIRGDCNEPCNEYRKQTTEDQHDLKHNNINKPYDELLYYAIRDCNRLYEIHSVYTNVNVNRITGRNVKQKVIRM